MVPVGIDAIVFWLVETPTELNSIVELSTSTRAPYRVLTPTSLFCNKQFVTKTFMSRDVYVQALGLAAVLVDGWRSIIARQRGDFVVEALEARREAEAVPVFLEEFADGVDACRVHHANDHRLVFGASPPAATISRERTSWT